MKNLYLVRHCQPKSQHPSSALTSEGKAQAETPADFLLNENIERIVSSPYARARESIVPFARRAKLTIELDERLVEHRLSSKDLPDWMEKLRQSFANLGLVFEGGESSREAMHRGIASIAEILKSSVQSTVIVTHGKLMTLLLKKFDDRFGFENWKNLTNPDLYLIQVQRHTTTRVERLWNPK
jgi:2,3-bisphosphoglycerate-dependent phosphoglycerate mutase